jgi:hypothetical protein
MAGLSKIPRGTDAEFIITVNGVDLAALQGYCCWVYSQSGVVLAQFSKNNLNGFNSTEVVDETLGKFKIHLTSIMTRDAEPGIYLVEVKAQTSVNAQSYLTGTIGTPLCEIIATIGYNTNSLS